MTKWFVGRRSDANKKPAAGRVAAGQEPTDFGRAFNHAQGALDPSWDHQRNVQNVGLCSSIATSRVPDDRKEVKIKF